MYKILILLCLFLVSCDTDYEKLRRESENPAPPPVEVVEDPLEVCNKSLNLEKNKNKLVKKMREEANQIQNENLTLKAEASVITTQNQQLMKENKELKNWSDGNLIYQFNQLWLGLQIMLIAIPLCILFIIFANIIKKIKISGAGKLLNLKKEIKEAKIEKSLIEEEYQKLKYEIANERITTEHYLAEAKEIINSDAVAEKRKIIDEAISEAEKKRQIALTESQSIIEKARSKANSLVETAKRNANAEVAKLKTKHQSEFDALNLLKVEEKNLNLKLEVLEKEILNLENKKEKIEEEIKLIRGG